MGIKFIRGNEMENQDKKIRDNVDRLINSSEEDIVKNYYIFLGQRLDLLYKGLTIARATRTVFSPHTKQIKDINDKISKVDQEIKIVKEVVGRIQNGAKITDADKQILPVKLKEELELKRKLEQMSQEQIEEYIASQTGIMEAQTSNKRR